MFKNEAENFVFRYILKSFEWEVAKLLGFDMLSIFLKHNRISQLYQFF